MSFEIIYLTIRLLQYDWNDFAHVIDWSGLESMISPIYIDKSINWRFVEINKNHGLNIVNYITKNFLFCLLSIVENNIIFISAYYITNKLLQFKGRMFKGAIELQDWSRFQMLPIIIAPSSGWPNVLIIARLCNNQKQEGRYHP